MGYLVFIKNSGAHATSLRRVVLSKDGLDFSLVDTALHSHQHGGGLSHLWAFNNGRLRH